MRGWDFFGSLGRRSSRRASIAPLGDSLSGEERDTVVRIAEQLREKRLIFRLRIPPQHHGRREPR